MVSILITDTNLVCTEWSLSENKNRVVTGIYSVPFDHPLSSLFFNEREINSTIEIAFRHLIENVSLHGKDVSVVVDKDIVTEEVVHNSENLHQDELYDYFLWKQSQKWGKNYSDHSSLYVQQYPENANQYLLSKCNSHLIEIIKLTISEHSGNPVWMGSHTTLLFDHSNQKTVFVYDDKQSYQYLFRGQGGLSVGKFRFANGQVKLSGNEQTDHFQKDNNIVLLDKLSDKKQKYWDTLSINLIDPKTSIILEGLSIPENMSYSDINLLKYLIFYEHNPSNINYFGSDKMKLWSAPPKKSVRKKKKTKKVMVKKVSKSKESKQYPVFIFFTLAILFTGLIYLNNADTIDTSFVQNLIPKYTLPEDVTEAVIEDPIILSSLHEVLNKQNFDLVTSFTLENDTLAITILQSDDMSITATELINPIQSQNETYFSENVILDSLNTVNPTVKVYKPEYTGEDYTPVMLKIETDSVPFDAIDLISEFAKNLKIDKIRTEKHDNTFTTIFYLSIYHE